VKRVAFSIATAGLCCAALLPLGILLYSQHPARASAEQLQADADRLRAQSRSLRRVTCGAVALQMVFASYRIDCSLADIIDDIHPTSRGATMLSLKRAAESRGLKASGWKLMFDNLTGVTMPVIALVNGNHYIVVDSVSAEGHVCIRDAGGERRLTGDEFLLSWKGETLVFDVDGATRVNNNQSITKGCYHEDNRIIEGITCRVRRNPVLCLRR